MNQQSHDNQTIEQILTNTSKALEDLRRAEMTIHTKEQLRERQISELVDFCPDIFMPVEGMTKEGLREFLTAADPEALKTWIDWLESCVAAYQGEIQSLAATVAEYEAQVKTLMDGLAE